MKLKKEKGITLIALVVTIIILIILAGVSINLVFGQSGLIARAKDAEIETKVASAKEQMQLKLISLQTEKKLTNENITTEELAEIITESEGIPIYDAEEKITGVKIGDTEIPIEEIIGGITIRRKSKGGCKWSA